MKSLKDLFEHELKDLYSAEKQMIYALPELEKAAHNTSLKKAFADHLKETKTQFERLKSICDELDINPGNTKCEAMEGLVKEGKGMIKEKADPDVKDAGLIATAQRVEHYEISGYGTAVRFAKELGYDKIAKTLQKTLDEEYSADQKLDDLAMKRINKKARA